MDNNLQCSECKKRFSITVDKIKDKYLGVAIVQYTLQGKIKARYNSIQEASSKTEINRTSIIKCCKGRQQTAGGYLWQYEQKINE